MNNRNSAHVALRGRARARNAALPQLGPLLIGISITALMTGPSLAQDGEGYRIEAVTLSSGGLAEVRRSITLDDAASLGFAVPLDQIDDILKSLLVYDPAGGVAAITLDGPSPVEETFRGLPFSAEDLTALPRLLGTLQGVPVKVSSSGRTVEGMVLGVDTSAAPAEGEEPAPLLSVITEAGQLLTIRLRADTELDILDPAIRDSLRQAALVSGQSRVAGMRTITVGLEGAGPREVALDYVVSAPVWKTAYRLILDAQGKARLQAWAVIENASGDDWDDVEVTLSSGAPVTLTQRLYQRYWHQRPEVPVYAQSTVATAPDVYRETATEQAATGMLGGAMEMADTMRMMAPAAAPAPMEPSAPVAVAAAAEGETAATYVLPTPIDLAAGQTMSVPYIDAELTAERISLFQPERGEIHPIATLRLDNSTGTSLPPGIVTVYAPQEEGYAGDSQLANVPDGETRMISFAADRKVEVATEYGGEQTVYRATLADGLLRISGLTRSDTTYTVSGAADAPRTVVIEHPRQGDWVLKSDALAGTTPTHYRLEAQLAAGETAKVVATMERTDIQSFALVDADADTLLYWIGQLDDPATTEVLTRLAQSRQEIASAERILADLEQELGTIADGQERIRDNLAAVPADSTLARRYLETLEGEEDRIVELETRRKAAGQALDKLNEAFRRQVSQL
nr:DUF4139 domain-containing protein [uncultured Devosia sp.]